MISVQEQEKQRMSSSAGVVVDQGDLVEGVGGALHHRIQIQVAYWKC